MMSSALSQRGTALAAQRRTPAALAYAAAMKGAKRASRYQVVPKAERTVDGILFASKLEAKRYVYLCIRERLGEIVNLELQPSWKVQINGEPFCRYTSDFRFFDVKLQKIIVEEVKSKATQREPSYRLRRKAAELAHSFTVTEVVL